MKKGKGFSAAERAVLKARGNPYAFLQVEEDKGVAEPTLEQKRAYLRKLENPAAYDAVMGHPDEVMATGNAAPRRAPATIPRTVSKVDFKRGCKGIFAQYIPAAEKGRLRDHHRDFVIRNENSSGDRRGALLAGLQKYDLGNVEGLRPQFNRERDVLTEAKLRALERSIDKSSTE